MDIMVKNHANLNLIKKEKHFEFRYTTASFLTELFIGKSLIYKRAIFAPVLRTAPYEKSILAVSFQIWK